VVYIDRPKVDNSHLVIPHLFLLVLVGFAGHFQAYYVYVSA
jgi:hypothetical protein